MSNKIDVKVYAACKMTGCQKDDLVARAERVCDIFKEFGITPISPVIEEKVNDSSVKLVNHDKDILKTFWQRDKEILINEAHVMFWDHAEQYSFGAIREYAFNRFCLWKPTVIYVPKGTPTSVAEFEDDKIVNGVHEAAKYIVDTWGTAERRRKWRWAMLKRTFPTWLKRQYLACR